MPDWTQIKPQAQQLFMIGLSNAELSVVVVTQTQKYLIFIPSEGRLRILMYSYALEMH